jgi:hypothetical protein
MLGLRLRGGVKTADFERARVPLAGQFVREGLAVVEKGFYRLTPRGWLLSNQLFQELV